MARQTGPFSIDTFINKLATNVFQGMDDDTAANAHGWVYVGSKVLAKSRRVPILSIMYGPLMSTPTDSDRVLDGNYLNNKQDMASTGLDADEVAKELM
ncbi:hypothetical protein BDR05DRAFT_995868 [Suillus weaverae]|nr:hypothetical protein BDR05DRAFT_995868 [Suillus weaverae]